MRAILLIVMLALLHFLATPLILFFSYAVTMSQFDSGEKATLGQEMLSTALWLLLFPLHLLMPALPNESQMSLLGNVWGVMLVAANSVIWGVVLYLLGRHFLAHRH